MGCTKAERSRNLRYKRPALASMGYDAMINELYDISEACSEVHWFVDNDEETLLNALDGDEEAAWEFKMAFADLEQKAEGLMNAVSKWEIREEFDTCTVALIGNRYRTVGYDGVEEDYFALTGYQEELAHTEAGKKLMRHTKAGMIAMIGQCLGTLVAFLDLRQQYDYLKATMDILRDENTSLLRSIKEIQAAYEAAAADGFYSWYESCKKFDRFLNCLPDRAWLE